MEQKKEEQQTATKIQEEEREDALESLLSKVDMASPLEIPMDSGQVLSISQEQFIEYYLPSDASRSEKAKCFNETRAAGLNPAIRGDCHYFKTGGGPLSLFVGYHVYIRKAYANGLNHIHKPELIYDEETGKLDSCIITLEIEGRPDFIWETWLSEVVAERNGQPNSRWNKAERQMLIKCSTINSFRMAGIASIGILPPSPDEMPDFAAPGYKNLTQAQLGAHDVDTAEVKPGEVTATTHQIDTDKDRRRYFALIGEMELFANDDQRKACQVHFTGKESATDFEHDDFSEMFAMIASGVVGRWVQDNQPKPKPDPPESGGDAFLDNLDNVPEEHQESAQAEPEKGEEPAKTPPEWDVKSSTRKRIGLQLAALKVYGSPRSDKFKDRVEKILDRRLLKMQAMTEVEGRKIIKSLDEEIEMVGDGEDLDGADGMTPAAAKKEADAQEQEATWFESPEYAQQLNAYLIRTHGRWPDAVKSTIWHKKNAGMGSTRFFLQEHFDKANAALDREGEIKKQAKETGEFTEDADLAGEGAAEATPKEPTDGLCTDEEYDILKAKFAELFPDKQYAIGSEKAHDFIRTSKAVDGIFHSARKMTTKEVADLILALDDALQDNANPPSVA